MIFVAIQSSSKGATIKTPEQVNEGDPCRLECWHWLNMQLDGSLKLIGVESLGSSSALAKQFPYLHIVSVQFSPPNYFQSLLNS